MMPKQQETARLSGSRALPLAGITVVDLGQIYNGPYATFLMAMAGADIIKIEPPHGEPLRRRQGAAAGASLPFAMLNPNKRTMTLNLKSEEGRRILLRLAAQADILLENFAPGVLDRLGIGAAVLMAANPKLIYASGSGFGLSGPDKDHLAMDLTVQAAAGIMSVTGFADGPPVKAGPAVCDFMAGIHLYGAVMTALYERERTGQGRLVEVAMLEAIYASLASNLGMHYGSGAVPPRTGNSHGGLSVCPYNVYPAADGHVAIISVVEDHWRALATAMGQPELADDPRYCDNTARVQHMADVDAMISAWTENLTRAEVFAATQAHRIPAAPVRNLVEVIHDPHMHARGMLHTIQHPELGEIVVPHSPLRFHGSNPTPLTPSRDLGADTADILHQWLQLDAKDVAALRKAGAL